MTNHVTQATGAATAMGVPTDARALPGAGVGVRVGYPSRAAGVTDSPAHRVRIERHASLHPVTSSPHSLA